MLHKSFLPCYGWVLRLCPGAAWRAGLVGLSALALAACAGGPGPAVTASKPLPAPAPALNGRYRLVAVGRQHLPVALSDKSNHCSRQIDNGSLKLKKGNYLITRSVTRRCNGLLSARTLERARGDYGGTRTQFQLRADKDRLFSSASGSLQGGQVTVTPAGQRGTVMRFQRLR